MIQAVIGFVLIAAALLGAGILVGRRLHRMQPPVAPDPVTAPQYWVGISVYEGGDHDAAADAYEQLKQQEHQLPGDREWMSGDRPVRKFRVV